jgi:hypothetical protein
VEAVEVRKVSRLVDLIDICLFGREGDVLADFVAHIAEESVVDQILYHGVLISGNGISSSAIG